MKDKAAYWVTFTTVSEWKWDLDMAQYYYPGAVSVEQVPYKGAQMVTIGMEERRKRRRRENDTEM